MKVRVGLVIAHIRGQRIRKVLRYIGASGFILLFLPLVAHAQSGSPFDTGFTAIRGLRPSVKQAVARSISLIFRSTSRSSNAPPSVLTRPALKPACTRREK